MTTTTRAKLLAVLGPSDAQQYALEHLDALGAEEQFIPVLALHGRRPVVGGELRRLAIDSGLPIGMAPVAIDGRDADAIDRKRSDHKVTAVLIDWDGTVLAGGSALATVLDEPGAVVVAVLVEG